MATHSSIPAWGNPWTEEPGGLQSIGSQRVGHDLSDLARIHAQVTQNFTLTAAGSVLSPWQVKLLRKIMKTHCLSPSQTHAILLPKFHDVVCNRSVVSDFLQFYGLYVARQAPPSMGFSRQENWSGLPFPFPGDLLDPENEPGLLHCRQTLNHQATREALTLTMLWALISDSATLQRLFPALLQILATPATLGSWFLIQVKWLSKWDSPISWTGRISIT